MQRVLCLGIGSGIAIDAFVVLVLRVLAMKLQTCRSDICSIYQFTCFHSQS